MKRSEFVEIINAVADEERNELNKFVSEKRGKISIEELAAVMWTDTIDISARTTAKIIERLGLLDLTDD